MIDNTDCYRCIIVLKVRLNNIGRNIFGINETIPRRGGIKFGTVRFGITMELVIILCYVELPVWLIIRLYQSFF